MSNSKDNSNFRNAETALICIDTVAIIAIIYTLYNQNKTINAMQKEIEENHKTCTTVVKLIKSLQSSSGDYEKIEKKIGKIEKQLKLVESRIDNPPKTGDEVGNDLILMQLESILNSLDNQGIKVDRDIEHYMKLKRRKETLSERSMQHPQQKVKPNKHRKSVSSDDDNNDDDLSDGDISDILRDIDSLNSTPTPTPRPRSKKR